MRNLLRRLAYLGFYFFRLNWQQLALFMSYVEAENGWSKAQQWRRIIRDSLRFNISILEYYQFRFFELKDEEKASWAGTGTMYEYQRRVNPLATRDLLKDKRSFYKAYRKFFRHDLYALSDLRSRPDIVEEILAKNDVMVFKDATGNCGSGIDFKSVIGMLPGDLIRVMESNRFDLVETLVVQHRILVVLSPSAVNTVRIFTQITSAGDYELLGCRLRISVNSPVDNLAAGNMAASIDPESGMINGPGVYSDITRVPAAIHPITGCSIVGLQLPFWQETLAMVREASLLHPENRSVGWDVVITEEGPGLIEGNHDWCKLVWQLPVKRGLKHLLEINS